MPRPYLEIRADLALARDRMKAASWTEKGKHAEIFAELVIEALDRLAGKVNRLTSDHHHDVAL